MKKSEKLKTYIVVLIVILMWVAFPSYAEDEEPLELTVESDPDCLLSEAGDMTYFRFTLKNTLSEDYELEDLTLHGDLLETPKLISDSLLIGANDVLEFTLENVRVEEDEFDMELSFWLTWSNTGYSEDDVDHTEPIILEHAKAVSICIERFIEPVMTLSSAPEVLVAREGDDVTVVYTLKNDTKFDMTNITLQDTAMQQTIQLQKNTLFAGEQMRVSTSFQMGTNALELMPTAQYTVRGIESRASAAETVTVEYVRVDLFIEAEKYPATAEGTLFRITLINDGSHPMSDIRLTDEIGSIIADGINLEAGAEKTVSWMVPSAVSSGAVRYISFEASGYDCIGNPVSVKSPSAYEVLPFVESDQVRLQLSVSNNSSTHGDDGSVRLKLLIEVRNNSLVPITNAVITESDYFRSVVNEYATLSAGTTTFEKEFVVPAGTRSLTFVLTAMDPAQTQYATAPITMDLSSLTVPKPTSIPAIKPGKTVDITGTIYDTERYIKLFRMSALIVLALTLMFLLLSVIFHVAETNIRRWLPKEAAFRPFGPRRSFTGPVAVKRSEDQTHNQFGYLQPAKLRYMDRTDRMPVIGQEETSEELLIPVQPAASPIGEIASPSFVAQRNTGALRREGDITAVPIHKPRLRPVMISSDNTMPFAPVHEETVTEHHEETNETSVIDIRQEIIRPAGPRIIDLKPSVRIIPKHKFEIIHVANT